MKKREFFSPLFAPMMGVASWLICRAHSGHASIWLALLGAWCGWLLIGAILVLIQARVPGAWRSLRAACGYGFRATVLGVLVLLVWWPVTLNKS